MIEVLGIAADLTAHNAKQRLTLEGEEVELILCGRAEPKGLRAILT